MARNVNEIGEDQQVYSLPGPGPGIGEAVDDHPNGETIPRECPGNLSVLLDIIDSIPDDMLCDCHDGFPQERDGL